MNRKFGRVGTTGLAIGSCLSTVAGFGLPRPPSLQDSYALEAASSWDVLGGFSADSGSIGLAEAA
jgi:hypothetical protein